MMDRFTIDQVATKEILGDENVFEDIATPNQHARVGRYSDHDVPPPCDGCGHPSNVHLRPARPFGSQRK